MSIMVTGATGFVGRALVARLISDGTEDVTAISRRASPDFPATVDIVDVGELSGTTDWRRALAGVTAVVHAAARVHVMGPDDANAELQFRRVNVDATINLARQAADAGVRRFVFISSIKVNGESTDSRRPFASTDEPSPVGAYGMSKYLAERGLHELARETGLEVVVIRPVLVYGPGVKANFRAMMRWVNAGIPLPLGGVHNARSLVAINNLVDLIVTCLRHAAAPGQVFMVSDGDDLSTTELLTRLAAALGRPARLIPITPRLLRIAASLVGKSSYAARLCDSLQVDIQRTQEVLGWTPIISVDEALSATALEFQRRRESAGVRR